MIEAYVCPECGLVVGDQDIHTKWHHQLLIDLGKPVPAQPKK